MTRETLRSLIRYLLAPAGSLQRRIKAFLRDPHSQCNYSQEGEDLVLQRILHGVQHGFYVDVGAHHPWRFSNTYLFYQQGWTGLNIEPNPDVQRLFARYRSRDINIECGIAENTGHLTYYRFDEPAINTFDATLVKERLETTHYRLIGTQEIAVKRLDGILDSYLPNGRTIDFLSVDVEGLDLAVLRSNNWQKYRPRVVLAEVLGMSFEHLADGELAKFMNRHGYELFAKTYNTVFFIESRG